MIRFKETFFRGYPIEYDYYYEGVSVTWESDTTAIVRFHDPNTLPQDCSYYGTAFLTAEYETGTCELKALIKDPGPKVHRVVRQYLKYLGLRGYYRRLKKGKIVAVWYK